eukprot:gene9598-14904_t
MAKEVDGHELVPFFYLSNSLRKFVSNDLSDLVGDRLANLEQEGGMINLVRDFARKDPAANDIAMGFDALRRMNIWVDMVRCELTPFQPGDVVQHRSLGEVGVVLKAYDKCTMEKAWIQRNIGSETHPFLKEPWFDILLDQKYGGYIRFGARRNHFVVKQSVKHALLWSEGWVYDEKGGRYSPPDPADRDKKKT